MSMISEQVRKLRDKAFAYGWVSNKEMESILLQAADTIEALSAKLHAANMERTAENCGGWIYCKDGNNMPKESGYYDVTIESEINGEVVRTTECRCFHKDIELWAELIDPEFAIDEIVIAWRRRPEPYHEP